MTREDASMVVSRIRYYMEGSELWTDAEFEAMDMAIEALRQPEQRWIPVTERLPEEKKDVLAVDDEGFFYIAQYSVYNRRGYWEETTEYLSIDAVAWQPLPEPWKGK